MRLLLYILSGLLALGSSLALLRAPEVTVYDVKYVPPTSSTHASHRRVAVPSNDEYVGGILRQGTPWEVETLTKAWQASGFLPTCLPTCLPAAAARGGACLLPTAARCQRCRRSLFVATSPPSRYCCCAALRCCCAATPILPPTVRTARFGGHRCRRQPGLLFPVPVRTRGPRRRGAVL